MRQASVASSPTHSTITSLPQEGEGFTVDSFSHAIFDDGGRDDSVAHHTDFLGMESLPTFSGFSVYVGPGKCCYS